MSDLVAAAAEALGGAPEELVRRSAQARAQAQGVSLDEVLQSWTGGADLAAAPTAPPPEAAPAADAPAAAPPPEAELTPEPAIQPAPAAPVAAPVPAAPVAVLEPEEQLEPAPLGGRVRLAATAGGIIGLVLGIVFALGVSPLVLERVTVIGEEPYRAGIEVTLVWMIIVTALVSAVFGALIAVAARLVPGWFHPAMALRGSTGASAWLGALIGLILGAVAAPLTSGLTGETIETGVVLSVRGTLLAVVIGGAALGAVVAAAVQLLGQPVAVTAEEEEEVEVVKHRLTGSILIPLAGLGAIALLVLPFALLLLEFHSVAPALAIVAATGILTFAFLAAYQPGLKITRGEFILAAAGIGIVLLVIVLAVLTWGSPEEPHGEEAEALLRWLIA